MVADRSRRGDQKAADSGAAAVEMALVLLLLVGIVIGISELGIAFRDWLSVSTATRSGARVASAVGDDVNADCLILEATAGALVSVPIDDIESLWIFQADTNGDPTGQQQVFRPGNVATPDEILVCGNWLKNTGQSNWEHDERKVVADDLDIVGVRVNFTHHWVTNFPPFVGTADFQDDAIMRMEPQFFSDSSP